MAKTKIFRTVIYSFPTILISKIIFPRVFVFSNFTKIVRRLTENFPKNNFSRVLSKHFPEFYIFPKFSEKFETILVNVRFLFCFGAEFIGQDGAILPDDQPINMQESRAEMCSNPSKSSRITPDRSPTSCGVPNRLSLDDALRSWGR